MNTHIQSARSATQQQTSLGCCSIKTLLPILKGSSGKQLQMQTVTGRLYGDTTYHVCVCVCGGGGGGVVQNELTTLNIASADLHLPHTALDGVASH